MDCSDWITDFLAHDPPRSKSLVVTIFGDAIVPHGGMVWLGSLIELLAPFGVNDRLLRTAVFRLAQEGWLGARRDGRRSAYAITPDAMARFSHAYRRIYAEPHAHWDGHWTLVLSGERALTPAERTAVRKELLWEGYSVMAPGILAHPAAEPAALADVLGRLGVSGKLFVVRAATVPGVGARPLGELVATGWDLRAVAAAYELFIARFAPLRDALGARGTGQPTPQQAFVIRTLLIHAYRRVQLHDPQLPADLLPSPWPGTDAYALARQLYLAVHVAAEQHIDTVLRRADPAAAPAEAAFYARFGGLR
ncbi:transcriptional regulator [Duganella sp. Leaf126]|uniref:phenylacetic acid degradation operon negative regulatory protein PaaX n=1 Tax=Duganella sp. Leaf126 TaxID=1736266 RepID=UPI0006FD7756|nr:phenylacetic acid degradation operon negative regulatory protein PaaX [Duganella sp. Leaf126]KQQ47400.1 transcriptional regulator [Duganella sp. Leaf126]